MEGDEYSRYATRCLADTRFHWKWANGRDYDYDHTTQKWMVYPDTNEAELFYIHYRLDGT